MPDNSYNTNDGFFYKFRFNITIWNFQRLVFLFVIEILPLFVTFVTLSGIVLENGVITLVNVGDKAKSGTPFRLQYHGDGDTLPSSSVINILIYYRILLRDVCGRLNK